MILRCGLGQLKFNTQDPRMSIYYQGFSWIPMEKWTITMYVVAKVIAIKGILLNKILSLRTFIK